LIGIGAGGKACGNQVAKAGGNQRLQRGIAVYSLEVAQGVIADVTHLGGDSMADAALNPQVPLLRVGVAEVRVERGLGRQSRIALGSEREERGRDIGAGK